MRTRWRMWGCLILLGAVLLSGCAKTVAANTTTQDEVPMVAETGGTVVAEAVIEPARWEELGFDAAGEVVEVLVTPGDLVVGGAPLVRLDAGELELSLQSAQQDVVAQRAALDQLLNGASETLVARAARENAQQIAQAEVALRVKQLQLQKAQAEDAAADVAAAQARVKQLKLQLAQARAQGPTPDVRAAQVELERAQIALDETRDEYNKALDRPWEDQEIRDGWAKQLKQAELDYQLAQAHLEGALNAQKAHAISLDALAAQVDEAEEQLTQAMAAQEAYALTLEVLSAEVEAARLEVEALRAWENPYLDEATEEEVIQAEAQLRQAEIAVARLELQLRDAELRAPLAGTVVDVQVEVGDRVGLGEVVVVLATLDRLYARTVDLTELDVARVTVGQQATVTVDALPDHPFAGTVREIALQSEDYRGDVVYAVTVDLADAEGSDALRWGMTAMVKIEAE
jgi:multidrug efflux pump subunit AcrA (membrane-fusion protein)